jgi:hypothetical protein
MVLSNVYFNTSYIGYINVTRDNVITTEIRRKHTIVDTLPKNVLLNNPKFTIKTPISSVTIKARDVNGIAILVSGTKTTLLSTSYTLGSEEDYAWFSLDSYCPGNTYYDFSYSAYSGSGKAELIDANDRMIYVKFTGTANSVINLTCKGYTVNDAMKTALNDKEYYYSNDTKGDSLSIDTTNINFYTSYSCKSMANYYLNSPYKYSISLNTIGDPSLEVGDDINVDTIYDNVSKHVIITKQKFTYDGGLSCELEGIGD